MKDQEHFRQMVRDSYSSEEAIDKYTKRVAEGLRRSEKALVEQFFPERGQILVVGCGAGREAFALEHLGFEVTGVDISEVLILKAQQIAKEKGSHIRFHISDGVQLDFIPEFFDVITLWSQILGNVPGQMGRVNLLRECCKVLKPGGMVSFTVHDMERSMPLLPKEMVVSPTSEQSLEEGDLLLRGEDGNTIRYWHWFTEQEIKQTCWDAGFGRIQVCHTSDLGETWDNVFVVIGSKSEDEAS